MSLFILKCSHTRKGPSKIHTDTNCINGTTSFRSLTNKRNRRHKIHTFSLKYRLYFHSVIFDDVLNYIHSYSLDELLFIDYVRNRLCIFIAC